MTPRVAFVASHSGTGGSEHYLELLLEELGAEWIAGVVALQAGPLVNRLRCQDLSVTVVPTGTRISLLPAAVRVRAALQKMRPDMVHANGVKAALVSILATTGTNTPVVWVKHDYSWDGVLANLIAHRADRIVAVARAITTTFGPRLTRKVAVVPNGVPSEVRRDQNGRRVVSGLVESSEAAVVTLVGRFHPAKGQMELVKAIPGVLERSPGARFLFVGGDDPTERQYADRVRARVAELGVGRYVTFAGHRTDVLSLMSGSDVVVVPSMPDGRGAGREACPYALLEAMAVGTPVVAHASGGIPDVLEGCGRLVPEGAVSGLVDAIATFIGSADDRRESSVCGVARIKSHFSLSATVTSMQEVYRELAESAAAPGPSYRRRARK